MKQRKLRVLLDLSLGLRGYSGIPQDTRLLYKTFATCPDVEVTGFVYPASTLGRLHRFCSSSASRADRVANQAALLWSLEEQAPPPPSFRPLRLWKRLMRVARIGATRHGQLNPLDVDAFWQVVWRKLFRQTLSVEDLSLVQHGKFMLMNVPADLMHARVVANLAPIRLDTRGYDFLIVQTARPLRTSPGTRQIVRYHDTIPILQPDTTPHVRDIAWHHHSICQSPESVFVCNSEPTREKLIDVYPDIRRRSETIPYTLSDAFRPESSAAALNAIIGMRRSPSTEPERQRPLKRTPRYIMGVSTLEPRKNFTGLIQAFNAVRFRSSMRSTVPNLKLLIVGAPGWKFEPILAAMKELVARGDVIHLEAVTAEELRVLYSHAEAFVYPSHAEGFGFPPLEAMQCEVPVIASDLPEHRWVLDDAALYCNSYDVGSIADAIERLVASEEAPALRAELVEKGRQRIEQYTLDRCRDQWLELLQRLAAGGPATGGSSAVTANLATSDLMEQAA